MRILCGASDWRSAWASVLQAMNSTPIISARIIRFTALLPPPPTPMTRISAKFSESERNGIGFSSGDPRGHGRRRVAVRRYRRASTGRALLGLGGSIAPTCERRAWELEATGAPVRVGTDGLRCDQP